MTSAKLWAAYNYRDSEKEWRIFW